MTETCLPHWAARAHHLCGSAHSFRLTDTLTGGLRRNSTVGIQPEFQQNFSKSSLPLGVIPAARRKVLYSLCWTLLDSGSSYSIELVAFRSVAIVRVEIPPIGYSTASGVRRIASLRQSLQRYGPHISSWTWAQWLVAPQFNGRFLLNLLKYSSFQMGDFPIAIDYFARLFELR
jgi:hypothetical protein